MKILKNYVIIIHRNGKQKLYTTEKYKWICVLKTAAVIVVSLVVLALMCGAVIIDNHPLMPFQLVFLIGLGVITVVGSIYLMLNDKE